MAHVITSDDEAIETARSLANQFAKRAAHRDAERVLPVTELDELSTSGLLAITVPREHGGAEVSARALGEVIRLLSAADPNIGQIPQNHFFFVEVLRENGAPEQQAFFYKEVLAGKRFGNALAEAGARHANEFRTKLTPDSAGGYRLNGTKNYSTGALFAHWIPVFVTDSENRVFVAYVQSDTAGVAVIDDWNGIGQRTTASGTVLLDNVHVPDEHVVPHYRTFQRSEIFGAFGQYIHAAIDVGIAGGALTEGGEFIRTSSRPWWESGVQRAAEEPLVIQRFGELALLVRAAEALLERAGRALDEARAAFRSGVTGDRLAELAAEASVAVAAARAQGDTAAITVSTDVFALAGTRSALRDHNLDRHWRNARTHTLHDPRRWKVQHIGNHALNGVAPPPNGIV
ncbi:SfnB family sulfur acquisition oxidoreductase [Longimycelium tulufanense]|uniref:Dibenzothiophene monooxygenase n=1 Tax=Longimycelium tulufanense TaxID=907463 RepID=A0A8J3FUZ5_9PSEU|nr:SfnB family sulfur acquisition oxidoreductase [Longimycelium tulufanense]GGM59168.1 SfnB family sulfur acquisition oxidoreductase [Longimycelium tulufanense]